MDFAQVFHILLIYLFKNYCLEMYGKKFRNTFNIYRLSGILSEPFPVKCYEVAPTLFKIFTIRTSFCWYHVKMAEDKDDINYTLRKLNK